MNLCSPFGPGRRSFQKIKIFYFPIDSLVILWYSIDTVKERGKEMFTEYSTNNETLATIFFAYCEGKSFLWRMFFGWRHTRTFLGENVYTFIIPTNKVEELEEYAKDLDKTINL